MRSTGGPVNRTGGEVVEDAAGQTQDQDPGLGRDPAGGAPGPDPDPAARAEAGVGARTGAPAEAHAIAGARVEASPEVAAPAAAEHHKARTLLDSIKCLTIHKTVLSV